MTSDKLIQRYDIDWDAVITECDYNNDGVIDFQEFISACIDRKVLSNKQDVKIAFRILDTNKDGTISLEDFDDLFNSYGGAKMDNEIWTNLLAEADKNGDGVVSFDEF
jgi:calcium-dependent protein kinase